MMASDGTWPGVPPEVPPPRRPEEPDEPGRDPGAPPTPMVVPPARREPRLDEYGLLARRTVLLLAPLTHGTATRAAAEVMALDADGDSEITLHLCCREGELLPALMLAETIDLAASPVVAMARGVVGGAALAPFAAADRRTASRHATFRLGEPEVSLSGTAGDLPAKAEELLGHVDQLRAWVVAATGQPGRTVAGDMERGRLLDADAARAYGLIDEVPSRPDERPD